MCSLALLSSCTLTQQQVPFSAEDIAAQQLAASELETALEVEEKRLIQEAKEEAERLAREEAERIAREEAEEQARREAEEKAEAEERAREEAEERARKEAEEKAEAEERAREEAEEKARKEAEEKAEAKERPRKNNKQETSTKEVKPQHSDSNPKAKAEDTPVVPTAEQQKAALEILKKQETTKPASVQKQEPQVQQEQEEALLPGSVMSGALRTRRFAPPEEAISRDDEDEPMPNTVELRGLRSPVMKGNLPMNIDGKMIKED